MHTWSLDWKRVIIISTIIIILARVSGMPCVAHAGGNSGVRWRADASVHKGRIPGDFLEGSAEAPCR
jgi:hypothetical protein